jgi:hypothetical protein
VRIVKIVSGFNWREEADAEHLPGAEGLKTKECRLLMPGSGDTFGLRVGSVLI